MSQRAPTVVRRLLEAFDDVRAAALSLVGLGFFTAACLVAADLRRFADVDPGYGFLRFNLALAWVPLILAYALAWAIRHERSWAALPALAFAWIVFLPNAPYLVTDLVHLREQWNWPNGITLSLLAVTGLLIGFKALQLVQNAVESVLGVAAGWRTVRVVAALTAFGIYLGRVKRWNSWTIIEEPRTFLHAVLATPARPERVGWALVGTLMFATLFYIGYRLLAVPSVQAAPRAAEDARPRVSS